MRRCPALLVLVLALTGSGTIVHAQSGEALPDDLQEVGVTEHLDARIPLDLEFTDDSGRRVTLGDYFVDGRPVLLTLAYYRCPMLCSLVLEGQIAALDELDWTPGERFEIVTVSIDPTDTTTRARQKKQSYVSAYGRPEAAASWHFLTGKAAAIEKLAGALGFGYRYLPDEGEYAHPAVLFVLTPDGRIARYLYGVRYEPQTVRLSLVEASEGRIGSALDRVLLYCYRYDETEGRYGPVAMKIMRLGGGITLLILGAVLIRLWLRDLRQRRVA